MVDSSGCIEAPLIGKVAVAGLTLAEAGSKIAEIYVAKGYYTRQIINQVEVVRH